MTDRKTQVTGDWAEGKTYTAVISDRSVGHGFVDPRFTATEALRVAMDQAALVAANPGLFDTVEIENMVPLSFTIWPIDAEEAGDAIHVFDEGGLFNLNNGWTWVEAGEIAGSLAGSTGENAGSLAGSLEDSLAGGNAGSLAPGTVVTGSPLTLAAREALAAHARAVRDGFLDQSVRERMDTEILRRDRSLARDLPAFRNLADERRTACVNAGTHKIVEADNNYCRTCDTGNCTDCDEPVFWVEAEGWYRHLARDARACFLIQTEDPYVAAKEKFLQALNTFLDAGKALVDAWDCDGFNADEWAGLPSEIAPPMSLDEWFDALSEHYARA